MELNEFLERAKKVHGDKYSYKIVEEESKKQVKDNVLTCLKSPIVLANSKIKIICPKHGVFEQRLASHLSGCGCPECCYDRKRERTDENLKEFIKKAIKKHGKKYDYSKVEYINNHTKVCIICPDHGEFWQTPNSHLCGSGCPSCAKISRSNALRDTKKEFVKKAIKVHGDKYDYSKVKYVNAHTKVCIICPDHGEFWQTPMAHLKGCKCSKC